MAKFPVDREQVREDWKARGFSCDLWVDPPGQVWEGFVHDTDELILLLDGEIEMEIAVKTLRPAAGEEVFIPRGASHSMRNIGGTTARWLYGYNE